MFGVKFTEGVKVAVTPEYVKVPAIVEAPVTINEEELIVEGFISSLKVTVITWLRGTFVAALSGFVSMTNGHTPAVSWKSSSAQPEIKVAKTIAIVTRKFFCYIIWIIYETKVNLIYTDSVIQQNVFVTYILLKKSSGLKF